MSVNGSITHVSDTALMVAAIRAVESERADAFMRDPFASRLAGDRGMAIFRALPHPDVMHFGVAVRNRFLDELVLDYVASAAEGAAVLCLGAGLDTRPWRLDLPPSLRWIEVDFAEMLDYKDGLMAGESPRCARERMTADLNHDAQRRRVFEALAGAPTLMITEGLLMYLPGSTVGVIAEDAASSGVTHWIADVTTSAFTRALGGGGTSSLRHVQSDDHLTGEDILSTISARGWQLEAHRSYIRDLAFAADRIREMAQRHPEASAPPAFAPNEPSGVHRFARA